MNIYTRDDYDRNLVSFPHEEYEKKFWPDKPKCVILCNTLSTTTTWNIRTAEEYNGMPFLGFKSGCATGFFFMKNTRQIQVFRLNIRNAYIYTHTTKGLRTYACVYPPSCLVVVALLAFFKWKFMF